MNWPVPETVAPLSDQPVQHIVEAGGIYFRSILLKDAGTVVPQHVHDHDHVTFIGSGRVRGWKDGEWIGDRGPGEVFEIPAGSAHVFQAIAPDTLLACVHDMDSALSVKRKGV